MSANDLKFFTNEESSTLYDRFNKTLRHTKYFDVLVGYFRASGFHLLQDALANIDKVRILIGLNVDKPLFEVIDSHQNQQKLDFEATDKIKDSFRNTISTEIETAKDEKEVEDGISKFVEFMKQGKIEVRAHKSQNLHAKVYIMRHPESALDFGRVITGSSNFSENGLNAQREFNVELKDRQDVDFALEKFNELWIDGIDLTKDYIDWFVGVKNPLQQVSPYDLYLKFLYEYFKEEINEPDVKPSVPNGFMELEYQSDAVKTAKRILNTYNGVFLADVVGLGKTYITAMLLQIMDEGRKLIICPPTLIENWREVLNEFYVHGFDVESIGSLDKIIKKGIEKYDYVIIDEAHRFRNEMTSGFDSLYKICKNKKVALVSATPLNNSLKDLEALLKLFMNLQNSPIPGIRNVEKLFNQAYSEINKMKKGSEEHLELVKFWNNKIREKILRHVMVRRTRADIKKFYKEDLQKQGLKFPKILPPEPVPYEFDVQVEKAFDQTIDLMKSKEFVYSRYTPLLYLKAGLTAFQEQQQFNARGFMRQLLVKRLESSFYAFKNTLSRFIKSYERFIEMFDSGDVYIGRDDVFSWIENEDFDRIEKAVAKEDLQKYKSTDFEPNLYEHLQKDLEQLKELSLIWRNIDSDPKFDAFLKALKSEKVLQTQKLIVFTEAKETADYLYEQLVKHYPNETFAISGAGGLFCGETYGFKIAKDIVEENYKPSDNARNDIRILITTDVLSEGVNLHRSNVLINYDLPWNPTRVLQRVGRVNRVGTQHETVHLFNFFPTAKSDKTLNLKDNIIAKINAFHSALGEDAKYLSTDDEQLNINPGLRGAKLYTALTTAPTEDDDFDPTLGYQKLLRDIRDKDTELFVRIKNMPKKIRSTQKSEEKSETGLLTFFRKGALKKFVYSTKSMGQGEELDLPEAIKRFECKKDEKLLPLPNDYYELLKLNKEFLGNNIDEDEGMGKKGKSNIKDIVDTIDAFKRNEKLTDDEQDLLKTASKNISNGFISKFQAKKMAAELKKTKNYQDVLGVVINFKTEWQEANIITGTDGKNEIILSKCFKGGK